jgi:hypothetical protein
VLGALPAEVPRLLGRQAVRRRNGGLNRIRALHDIEDKARFAPPEGVYDGRADSEEVRRASWGVMPYRRLNIRLKVGWSRNPLRKAISPILRPA